MQAAEAYRGVVVAEQFDGPGVQLGQPALGGVVRGGLSLLFLVSLPGLGDRLGVRLHPVAVRLVGGGDDLLVPLRPLAYPLSPGGEQ